MLNSRLGLFTAALSGLHPNRAPLLPKLRGHFAEFLNESSLDHLRDSLLAYLCRFAVRAPLTSLEAFLGSVESGTSLLHFARHHSSALWETDLPISQPNCLDADIQYRAYPILLRPPIAQMVRRWYRNINLLSIAYAFRPRLRSRLTLSGRAFLRKP